MQHYELLQQIGKGSYGKVYTARNYEDHQLYVLKRIPFDSASKTDADAAVREAQVLGLLRHPHIVPYKEVFNHDGDLCLVMAHCEGGDLFTYIKSLKKAGKVVEEELAWQWLVQLLLALSYCHSKKILHRDVKTQNVFLTKDGKLMLGDFGLAKQLQRTLEMARTPIGTPYYMAPEIYEEAPYSYKSDVWALGCVMYEGLTGKPAFAADNLSRVVMRVLKGTYDPLPATYSDALREIVTAMLQKEVKKRPNVNELLQHPRVLSKVQAYLDELSVGGAGAGWSTWRMKLPPGILVQMANIIAESQSRPTSSHTHTHTHKEEHHAGHASELEVLKLQLSVVQTSRGAGAHNEEEQYEDDFEDEDEEGEGSRGAMGSGQSAAAQQLLGLPAALTQPPLGDLTLKRVERGAGGRTTSTASCSQLRDDEHLSLGLPSPGKGFGFPPSPTALAGGVAEPRRMSAGGGGSSKQLQLAPLPGKAYPLQPPAPGFSFQSVAADKPATLLAPIPGWKLRGETKQAFTSMKSINLSETLTNRGSFLRKELERQLGLAGLRAACEAVQSLHDSSGDVPVSEKAIRAALSSTGSPAPLLDELAPLVDELVLLQQRSYAQSSWC